MNELPGKPDSLEQLLASMTPKIHESLKEAVALGRWENGERLSDEQKSLCLQAVIAYDQKYTCPEERVGYVRPKPTPCSPVTINTTDSPSLETRKS